MNNFQNGLWVNLTSLIKDETLTHTDVDVYTTDDVNKSLSSTGLYIDVNT